MKTVLGPIDASEKVGHSIKGGELRSAFNYGRVFSTLRDHVEHRREISVDRVSLAEDNDEWNVVVLSGQKRIPEGSPQHFQGWATMRVTALCALKCKLEPDPYFNHPQWGDGPYHANIILHADVGDGKADKEEFLNKLMPHVGWEPKDRTPTD